MSYILDALRRADAERERGVVPGLHTQNVALDSAPAARRPPILIWAGAAAVVAVLAVVAWIGPWRPAAAPVVASAAPATGSTPPAVQPVAAEAAPPAPEVRPSVVHLPAPIPAHAAMPAAPAVERAASIAATSITGAGDVAPRPPQAAEMRAQPTAVAAAPVEHYGPPVSATASAAAVAAIVRFRDLSPAAQAGLPHLAVGGAIYSEAPAERMLILNGQIYHEGDKPAADTVLEQIHHKSAVLNYRGTRYEIEF